MSTQNQSPIISLKNVTKDFPTPHGPKRVLNNVSFDVMPGELIAIIGPSGGGKSTCLRTINALETVTSGDIEVCGENYRTSQKPLHAIRRNTSMIFQRFELFAHLTALENVALAPQLVLGQSKDQAMAEALTLLDRVGLKEHAYKFPRALSGGQQQRVAIARSLAMKPKALLCDEPTSALDPELVGEIIEILKQIAASGMTMLCVTHEMQFAAKLSTRTLFLDGGEIAEQGNSQELFAHPKTERLRTFLNKVTHH